MLSGQAEDFGVVGLPVCNPPVSLLCAPGLGRRKLGWGSSSRAWFRSSSANSMSPSSA